MSENNNKNKNENESKDKDKGKGKGKGKGGSKSTSKWNPGKHGFPVLAYLTSHPLTLSCTLRIQHHEPRKQVTLMLRTCVALHGAHAHCSDNERDSDSDDEQAFVVQYDADNLVYDARFSAPTIHIPPTRLDGILRDGSDDNDDRQMQTLTLHLARPCPLWCPDREVLLPKPEPAHVELFNELSQLARAKTVHLVFDRSWLSLAQQVPLQRIIKGKEALTGFPVADYYSRAYRRADWTVFAPAPAPEPSNKHKRARTVSSPPSTPPPYKRQLVDPAHAGSPTEVATSPPSPRPIANLSTTETDSDFRTQVITAVVQRLLPSILRQLLPAVLPEVLPEVLPDMLRGLLPSLFALPPSFTSHASSTSASSSSPPPSKRRASPAPHTPHTYHQALASIPPQRTLTPLAAALLPHLLAHLAPQLSKLHNASTKKWIAHAALEHAEDAEQLRLELQQLVDEGVGELVAQAGYALDDVRARLSDVAVRAADVVGDGVREEVERCGLEAARKVRWEIDAAQKAAEGASKVEVERKRERAGRRIGRGKGGYRGVGCRRGC
ncbi:hypothetical protein G6514_001994 [Epicoccum nigrum]|nr:hypothetical protein G6514_001994 [Epicoccum nigrum]